jgi:hypothetical protein
LAWGKPTSNSRKEKEHKKNVGKRCLQPQKLLRTYSLWVKMWACTRILVRWRERQTRREAGAQSLYGPPRASSRRRPGCRTAAAVGSQSFAIREGRGCECDLTLWAINRELLGGNHRKFIAACSPRAAESQETLHLRGELDWGFNSHGHLQHQQSYRVHRRLRRRV